MKVILLNDIPKLGKKHDVKEVSNGHALNLLLPQGLAIAATPQSIKRAATQKAQMEGERKVHEELLAENLKSLDGVTLTISGKANDKGHLFAGLHREAIVKELLAQARVQVDPSFIQLDQPLKTVGEHIIEVKAEGLPAGQAGKSVKFKVVIEKA
jgi:large subunit ribosomal protein L9